MTATAIKPSCPIKMGLDFDNTIVCYDASIALLAKELLDLPPELPRTKLGIRDYLRAEGREPEWTAFQGELYGPGMRHAQPFEGAIETMHQLVANGHQLVIVSHRSQRPYAGYPHDLHASAREWVAVHLQKFGLFEVTAKGAPVYFLETLDEKIAMIAQLGCEAFLDDLPEVLNAESFPHATAGIHFDPLETGQFCGNQERMNITFWAQLPKMLDSL